ncbi:MAG: sulfite exporter TauE/SafE family protein [Alistipes sp.]|jgi:uncharacterized membrane protein YfcA|nr:sulfite exporter TauE/SafE family protein [Alistipes sp.]MBQ5353208.1 sulfite exporter TauE/SafE family protein [Alistipes sp.]MBQ6583909.1 sulfite exporter TauE/SafE family protein [Alistipes sp.]MEE0915097.1 sulfite exporter TauE/SafE family protein [Alistipes sp.]
MELDLSITIILIVSGIIVGAINTLAGGGSVVTVTMFTALGLPITIANGTNRIAVFLQNLTATITFLRKGAFNLKHGLLLSVPVIIGNIAGSLVATHIDDRIFKICFGVILVIILLYLIFDSYIKIKEGHNLDIKPWHYLLFLGIGFYGGYIYIGIGYLILAITLWAMRMDIMTANAIKNFVIFVATPFSLAVFIINGQIDYLFGIPHGVGNIIGSFLASHYASHLGKGFIKAFTLIIVLICFADLVGLLSLHDIFEQMMTTVCE